MATADIASTHTVGLMFSETVFLNSSPCDPPLYISRMSLLFNTLDSDNQLV